ncbi:MAG: hypothetical protein JSS05_02480 [Proteobacteria bacterium]|nr:hypothetical protein [Pseudomonadota bacterium]
MSTPEMVNGFALNGASTTGFAAENAECRQSAKSCSKPVMDAAFDEKMLPLRVPLPAVAPKFRGATGQCAKADGKLR